MWITILQILAIIAILIGTFFSIIGVVGFWRLPDVYTRLHTTGKVGVFGVVFLVIATALVIPEAATRAIVLIVMLLIVGPVTAHALASAAHQTEIPMHKAKRNDLDPMTTE